MRPITSAAAWWALGVREGPVNVDGAGVKVCVIPSESANLPEPSRSTPSPLTLPVARDPLPQLSPQDEIPEGAGTG